MKKKAKGGYPDDYGKIRSTVEKNARRHVLHFSQIEGMNYAKQYIPFFRNQFAKHHSIIRT